MRMPRPHKKSSPLNFNPQIERHDMAQGDHVALDFDDIKCEHSMKEEIHTDQECKCKKRRLKQDGHIVFVWYRICHCWSKTDREQDFDNVSNGSILPNYISMDGIDIHYKDECAYNADSGGWCSGYYNFRLDCHCIKNPEQHAKR